VTSRPRYVLTYSRGQVVSSFNPALDHIANDTQTQQWADFTKTLDSDPSYPDKTDVFVPYVLVHSFSQQDLEQTYHIDGTVKTTLSSATFSQLKNDFLAQYDAHPQKVMPTDFMIFDQQSTTDRTVVIIEKGADWLNEDGTKSWNPGAPGVTKFTVWRKYRAPFSEAQYVRAGIEGFCGLEKAEEFFVEEVERYECESGEEEEEEEETDSDGTTSEDLEYGDFPLKAGPK